jgi:chemotaxis-related protein WspD
MSQLLIGATTGASSQGRLVVARHAGGRLAFPVDEVEQVYRCSREGLQPLPATVARSPSSFTIGLLPWEGKMIGRLDERHLFEAFDRCLT